MRTLCALSPPAIPQDKIQSSVTASSRKPGEPHPFEARLPIFPMFPQKFYVVGLLIAFNASLLAERSWHTARVTLRPYRHNCRTSKNVQLTRPAAVDGANAELRRAGCPNLGLQHRYTARSKKRHPMDGPFVIDLSLRSRATVAPVRLRAGMPFAFAPEAFAFSRIPNRSRSIPNSGSLQC